MMVVFNVDTIYTSHQLTEYFFKHNLVVKTFRILREVIKNIVDVNVQSSSDMLDRIIA